ncbi:hypothetical protein [uncultured Rhodoblastus sp.]|uniref:hypothetical protein n=1 Tax=uncultured Rhodoblastus sp. TaxID=543037 RepID=UPI0025D23940|nr:hypothetical protein [uncultured Rhodoblastus sp.]
MNSNIIVTQAWSKNPFQTDIYGWPDPFLMPNALAMQDLVEFWLPPDRDCYLFRDQTTVDIKPTLRTTTLPPGGRTYQYLFHSPALGSVEVRAVWLDGRLYKRAKHCRILRMRPCDLPAAQAVLNAWLCSDPRPISAE